MCQQPYNVDTAMISCDVCEDWYHLRCMGMTQAAAKSMKKYTCPVCLALKGNSDPLQAALAKVCCRRIALPPAYMLLYSQSSSPESCVVPCLLGAPEKLCQLPDKESPSLSLLPLPGKAIMLPRRDHQACFALYHTSFSGTLCHLEEESGEGCWGCLLALPTCQHPLSFDFDFCSCTVKRHSGQIRMTCMCFYVKLLPLPALLETSIHLLFFMAYSSRLLTVYTTDTSSWHQKSWLSLFIWYACDVYAADTELEDAAAKQG